jgi:LmbE family N-acetylglucosaminyl deacetylase
MGERVLPHFYVDITGTLEKKLEMLSCHKSQRDWLRAHHGVDEYLEQARRWGARYGRECGCYYAEGLRRHLGHGYPHEPRLQNALNSIIKTMKI